jgi:glycosyltransferase involved in cell wall biosynthesis
MNIAIFTNNYLPNPFGVSGSVESFRKEFERLGHTVYIFAPRWKEYVDKNPNIFRYPSIETNIKIKFPLPIPHSRKISKFLENLELDIIHSQHPNLLGSAAARWARRKKIPLVFTWHTLYDQYTHFFPLIPEKLGAWWAIRNARNYANKADAVITPTPSVAEIIKKWGVTNENITAIPTGVEEDQFENPDRAGVREKYGIKNDEILLLLVSRLTAEKNILFLAGAVKDILNKNTSVKFMICGDGDLKDNMKEIFQKSGLSGKIIFTGIVSDTEKKNYFAAGDVFVFTSKSETQGMILTEAMYSGLPIVAVRATGAQDIVENGRTGFLVRENKKEFGEVAQKLIDDANLRKKFGEVAAKVAREKYASKVCAERMLDLYKRTISSYVNN